MALFGDKQKRSNQPPSELDSTDTADLESSQAAFEKEARGSGESSKAGRSTGIRAVPSRPAPSKRPAGTLEKLAALHGSRARLKRLCAEALKVILEAFGVQRGALLIYDSHRQCLALAAERGLGQSGKQCLRRVRRDDPLSWDMPLHGLLNERAYLIEDPAENRYVPQLLEVGNRRLARIACVPIYRLRSPVGAFVLLTGDSNRLTETEIRLSYVSLRYVAMIIDDAREREGTGEIMGTDEQRGKDRRAKAALMSSVEGTAPEERYAGLLREIPAALEQTFTGDEAPQEILLTEEIRTVGITEEPSPQSPAKPDASGDLCVHEQEAPGEIVRLRKELAGAVADLERRTAEWEDERDQALAALRAELVAEHERGLAGVSAERDELAARVGSLAQAFESAQAELRTHVDDTARISRLDSELAAAREAASKRSRRLEAAQSEVEAHRRRIDELEGEFSRLEAESTARERSTSGGKRGEGVDAELAARAAEIGTLTSRLAATEAKVEAGGRTIQELKAASEQLTTERDAALEDVARAAEHARILETSIELSKAEATELAARLSAAQAKDEANSRAVEALKATTTRLEADRATLAERGQSLEKEVRRLHESVAAHEQTAREMKAEVETAVGESRAAAERERLLSETLEQARSEWQTREKKLNTEIEKLRDGRAAVEQRLTTFEASLQESSAALEARAAAEAATLEEISRLRESEAVLRQQAERSSEEAKNLSERIAELDQVLERAAARSAEIEANEAAARQEAARWREEAGKVAQKASEVQEALEKAGTRSAEVEAEETAAREETERWREEAGKLAEKVTELAGALEVATARSAEVEAEETAARQQAEQWREEAGKLAEKVTELAGALEVATARSTGVEAEETAARQEAARWREEAGKLGDKVSEFERVMEGAAARSAEMEARETAARQEAEQWSQQAKKAAEKLKELERALAEKASEFERVMEGAAARSAQMEARETTARQEAEQWSQEAKKAGDKVSELERALAEKASEFERVMEGAAARSAQMEAALVAEREQAVQRERELLGDDAEKLRERTVELSKSLETAEAEKARLVEQDKQAQAEAVRWQKTAKEFEQRVAAMEQQEGQTEGEGAVLSERVQKLDEEFKAEEQKRVDLEAQVARLESERRAAYADAARARDEAGGTEQRVRELESERNEYAQSVKILEAAVARLEAERAIHSQQQHGRLAAEAETEEDAANGAAAGRSRGVSKSSSAGGAKGEAKTAKGQQKGEGSASALPSLENERFAIIEPSDDVGQVLAGRIGSQAQLIAATGNLAGVLRRMEEAHPTVAVVNLGSRGAAGGFNVLQALQQSDMDNGMQVWAYVAPPQAAKAIALGFIQRMPQPAESKDLVAWLKKLCGSGIRVLTVGLEMDGLASAQEQLKRNGISLSMAWDSKQGQELLEMVNPRSVVVNLDLPRGDGYRTLGRMAVPRRKHTWVLCGGETPPAEAGSLVATGATQGSAAKFLALPDVGSALLDDLKQQALDAAAEVSPSGKGRQKGKDRGGVSGGRGRTAEAGIRRNSAAGSQRRMSGS